MANSKNVVNAKKVAVGVGAGLAAAALASAGYYFFGHPKRAVHRKKAMKWAQGLHADVVKKTAKLEKLNEKAYHAVIDEAMTKYAKMKSVAAPELAAAVKELKSNWASMEREAKRAMPKKKVATKKAPAKKAPAKKKKS